MKTEKFSAKTAVITAVVLTILYLLPAFVYAGPHDIVVVRPGGPSQSPQAQQQVQNLAKQIAKSAGWDSANVTGKYFNDEKQGLAYIKSVKPGLVLGSLGFYLKYREQLQLRIISQATVAGKKTATYYIVAKKGGPGSLADLKGKTLGGVHLNEPEFIQRIVLDNAIQFGQELTVKNGRSLRSLRKLSKGELDAVILDEKEYLSLKDLPFGAELIAIFQSKPLPNNGFMTINNSLKQNELRGFLKAGADFCSFEDAKTICDDFDIQGFSPISDSAFNTIRTKYKGN